MCIDKVQSLEKLLLYQAKYISEVKGSLHPIHRQLPWMQI
jgi:hypothetical protein